MKQGGEHKANDANRQFVMRAVKAGTTILDIAAALNIHDDTLRKHYRYEISMARAELKNKALAVLEDHLTDNSLDAAKFVLARIGGWTEKQEVENTIKTEVQSISDLMDEIANESQADT